MDTRFQEIKGHYGAHPVYPSGAVGTVTANTTTTHQIASVPRVAFIKQFSVVADTVPADADGTILLTLIKRVAATDSTVTLTSAFDLESLVTREAQTIALLSTLTDAQRTLQVGDSVYASIVNNSAALNTAPVGLIVTAELFVLR